MSERVWHQVTEGFQNKAKVNQNLSAAQFREDSFANMAWTGADHLGEEAEMLDSELGTGSHTKTSHAEAESLRRQGRPVPPARISPEAEGLRELARSVDTWATDAEMSPILNSGYKRWN